MTSEVSLKDLPIGNLDPHPQNPRAILRQAVVSGIAKDIEAYGFDPCHALIVRPMTGGRYQVISGHHRLAAAKQAGIEIVPCWVRHMSEEDAFYALIRNNRQGELSPLEIGIHALDYVKLDKRGMGAEGGGLKAYADGVGFAAQNVSKYRSAAYVYRQFIKANVSFNEADIKANEQLLSKTNHLGEIQKAPQDCWHILTSMMLEYGWTVQQTAEAVKRIKEFQIPTFWHEVFLPLPLVAWRCLDTREFSPKTVDRLINEAETIEQRILTFRGDVAPIVEELYEWLTENAPFDAWDVRKVIEYGRVLQAKAEAAEREEQERYSLGDWRDHIGKLTDGSVSLLLTDPPYGMGYQSDYRLDRTQERKHETIDRDANTEEAASEIKDCLSAFYPKLKEDAHLFCFCHWSNEADIRLAIEGAGYKVRGSLIWVKNQTGMGDPKTTFAPKHERIIHAVKGSPVLFSRPADVLEADRCDSERHPTEKPIALLKQLILPTTTEHELVADPFAGVASTLVAAKEIGRAFFGCEIDEGYFAKGSDRL